jgi:uncharacterized protein (DUF1501 family)
MLIVAGVAVMAPIVAAFYRPGERSPLPEIVIFVGAMAAASLFPPVEDGSWVALLVQVPIGLGAAYLAVALKRGPSSPEPRDAAD